MVFESDIELTQCFREVDRFQVELPDKVAFPLEVDDYLAWSTGPRAFLLYRDGRGTRPRGVVFHRSQGALPEVAAMCEWCHAVRARGGVKLLTASVDARRHVGLYLCADLGCLGKAREVPGADDFHEGLDAAQRRDKILARISTFVSRRLF